MDDPGTAHEQTRSKASIPTTFRNGFTAADVLDELCLRMVECRLVMQALAGQIDVDMRTLEANLHTVEHRARKSREAASLICQGAELVTARPHDTLPWNVTLRHSVAVSRGAVRVNPEPTRLEQADSALAAAVAAPPSYDHERKRRCTATNDDGSPCTGRALYLGNHCFANCQHHAPEDHITRHQAFRASAAARAEDTQAIVSTQVTYGNKVIDEWLHRRDGQPAWFHRSPAENVVA